MKFHQLIEYNRNIFFEANEAVRLVPDLLFFKKALDEVKASVLLFSFNIFK